MQSESWPSSMKQLLQMNNTFYYKELYEGNLTEICNKIIFPAFFEENSLSSFRDPFTFEIDISLDPYDSIWLKLITILVYVVEVIASMVMVAFVSFETQGLAGHFRTLINQLLSYLYGGVSIQICHYLNLSYLLFIFLILMYTAMPNRKGTFCNDCKQY